MKNYLHDMFSLYLTELIIKENFETFSDTVNSIVLTYMPSVEQIIPSSLIETVTPDLLCKVLRTQVFSLPKFVTRQLIGLGDHKTFGCFRRRSEDCLPDEALYTVIHNNVRFNIPYNTCMFLTHQDICIKPLKCKDI